MAKATMEKRLEAWIILGAILTLAYVLAFIGITQSYLHQEDSKRFKSPDLFLNAKNTPSPKCPKSLPTDLYEICIDEKIAASEKMKLERETLHAQQQMSEWAFWLLLVTWLIGFLSTAITLVGVYYVIRTFSETRKATQAAQESTAIAEKALYDSQRPWVSVSCNNDEPTKISKTGLETVVTFSLQNFGKSPATNVYVQPSFVFDDPEAQKYLEDLENFYRKNPGHDSEVGDVLFPNDSTQRRYKMNLGRTKIDNWCRQAQSSPKRFPLKLVGAVGYRASQGSEIHFTSFIFDVLEKNKIDGQPRLHIEDKVGTILPQNLVFELSPTRRKVT